MRKIQIRKLFEVAVEMRLSANYFAIILFQLNKVLAVRLRTQWNNGLITQAEYIDRLMYCITRETN